MLDVLASISEGMRRFEKPTLVVAWPMLSVLGGLFGLIAAGIVAAVVYTCLLRVLGVAEIRTIFDLVRRRLA